MLTWWAVTGLPLRIPSPTPVAPHYWASFLVKFGLGVYLAGCIIAVVQCVDSSLHSYARDSGKVGCRPREELSYCTSTYMCIILSYISTYTNDKPIFFPSKWLKYSCAYRISTEVVLLLPYCSSYNNLISYIRKKGELIALEDLSGEGGLN